MPRDSPKCEHACIDGNMREAAALALASLLEKQFSKARQGKASVPSELLVVELCRHVLYRRWQ